MSATPSPPATWAPGAVVPGTVYRIIRPLGQGGMGEVYEVEHDLLGTRRALKVLARHFAGREDLAERLRVEARGLARLKHPNLVEVYDLGTSADGRIFFAMELLKGATLRELLRSQGKLSPAAAVRVCAQVLDALDAAHAAGMLHRDVKPENVFVCRDGVSKLLDFGVAKAIDASTPAQSITGVGMTVGTPRYMSPEQAEGRPVDARTDLYSVGLVLWEALLGRPAFEDTDPIALATSKVTDGVARLDPQGDDGIPAALCAVVNRACEADSLKRYSTAEAFAAALRASLPAGDVAAGRSHPSAAPGPLAGGPTAFALAAGAARAIGTSSGEALGAGGEATEVDPGSAVGAGPTLPAALADAAIVELTERIEAAQAIDRDQPTHATPNGPPMRGPTGTQMLPAVAARHRAASAAAAQGAMPVVASAPVSEGATTVRRASRSGGRAVNWKGILAGVVAFVIPVSIAFVVGYTRLGASPPVPMPSATVLAGEPSAASTPAQEALSANDPLPAADSAEPAAATSSSTEGPATSASAEPPEVVSAVPARPPRETAPAKTTHPAATASTKPASTGKRPPTMPASGL